MQQEIPALVAVRRLEGLRVALAELEAHRYAQAADACRALLAGDPHDIEATFLLALSIGMAGDTAQTAVLLDRVARARPQLMHPARDLAGMLLLRGAGAWAVAQYRACLALAPTDVRLIYAFAELLRDGGETAEAVAILGPVLSAQSGSADAHIQMGLALAEGGQFAPAAEAFRAAIAVDPAPAIGWANLGMMLNAECQFDAALDACAQAIERSPHDAQIRQNRAVTRLHAGRFAEAWQDQEWHLSQPGRATLPPERLLPPLSLLPDLTGRTVLVVQEEGFGDSLQFMRYLPMLAARGARVAVAAPPELSRLLRRIPGVAEVPAPGDPVPNHDYHCAFNGLPRAFETELASIPAAVPYLTPDPALAALWAARLPSDGAFRVGLAWAGQARSWLPGFTNLDRRRSIALVRLAPLADIAGVHFVSLQKGAAGEQAHDPGRPFDLLDPMTEAADFADTAAIVANLDLVISVDTSVVHLAGAMGKPVFLLDRYDNCWRWLSGRDDSPWYPTLRIFRQQRSGEWDPVIARVAAALQAMLAARTAAAAHPFPTRGCRDAA